MNGNPDDAALETYLVAVPILADVRGQERALIAHAIVAPLRVDPGDEARMIVRVVEGGVTGLPDGATVSVALERLISNAEAAELLKACREFRP